MKEPEQRKSDNLAEQIVDLMFARRAFEDNPLTERFLSERFNTSRTPVRDALKTLETDNLIERRKKKGVFLTRPTPKMISDLYDLRSVLEGFAIREASESASAEDIALLEESARQFRDGMERDDSALSERANIDFHTRIIHLSKNDMLIGMIRNIDIIRKAFQYAYSLDPELHSMPSPCSHEEIIESVREHRADEAEERITRHVQVGKQRVLEKALGFKIGG